MSQYNDTGYGTVTLTGTVAKYQRVTFGGVVAGVDEQDIGTAMEAGVSGQAIRISLYSKQGTHKAIATGIIAAGAPVYCAAAGRVDDETGALLRGYAVTAAGAAGDVIEILPASGSPSTGLVFSKTVSFTENATNTIHTGTVEIPAGATLHNIQFVNTVLWGATSASLDIGDDDVADGWFDGINCKATDLLVGEVLDISNAENWGAKQGAYLVASTGRKGRTTAGIDSGIYYGAASEVIGVMTVGTPAVTTGRSKMTVTYSVGGAIAAVATGP